jgi:hypothetical protein
MAYFGGAASAAADPLKSSGLLMELYVIPPVHRERPSGDKGLTIAVGVGALDGCKFSFAPDAARGRPSLYHIHQRPEPTWPQGLRVSDNWEEQAEEQQRRRWEECDQTRARAFGEKTPGEEQAQQVQQAQDGEQDQAELAALATALGTTTSKDLNIVGGGGSCEWWRHELEGEGEELSAAVARGSGIKGSSMLRARKKRRQQEMGEVQGREMGREMDGFADDSNWDGRGGELEDGQFLDDGRDGQQQSLDAVSFPQLLSQSLDAVSLPELMSQRQGKFNSLTLSHFDASNRSQVAKNGVPSVEALSHIDTIKQWRQETALKNAIGTEKRRTLALAHILDDRLDPTATQIVTPVLPSVFLPSMSHGSLATLQLAPSQSLKMLTADSRRLLPHHEFRLPADNLQPRSESLNGAAASTSQNTPEFWVEMARTLPFKVVGPVVRLSQVDGTTFPTKVRVRLPHCCPREVVTGKRRSKKQKGEVHPPQATVVLAVIRVEEGGRQLEQELEVYDAVEHIGLKAAEEEQGEGADGSKKERLGEQMAVEGWVGLQGSCIVAPVLIQPVLSTHRPLLVNFVAYMPRSDIVADGTVLIRVWVFSHTPEQCFLAEELEEANRMWGSRRCGSSAPTRVGLGEMLTVALDGQVVRSRWLGKGPQCLDIHLRLPSFAENSKKWKSSRTVRVYLDEEKSTAAKSDAADGSAGEDGRGGMGDSNEPAVELGGATADEEAQREREIEQDGGQDEESDAKATLSLLCGRTATTKFTVNLVLGTGPPLVAVPHVDTPTTPTLPWQLAEAADMPNQRATNGDQVNGIESVWEVGKWRTPAGEAAATGNARGVAGDGGSENVVRAAAGGIDSCKWLASRSVTEQTNQPLLSTSTATPMLFHVPPLLRWLEQLGIAYEVARHYYTLFREGGCSELVDLFRIALKKRKGQGLCAKFPQLQREPRNVQKMLWSLRSSPRLLGYSADPATYEVGRPVKPNFPILDSENAGAAVSYSGLLPPGLVLDQASGTISGMPTTVSTETAFTVVVTNPVGSYRYDFAISIKEEQPF